MLAEIEEAVASLSPVEREVLERRLHAMNAERTGGGKVFRPPVPSSATALRAISNCCERRIALRQIQPQTMNTPRILLFLLLIAAITRARAQDNPAPAATTEPAPTEMQKWIATTDAQWQAVFKRDVTDVHEAELNKAKLQYLTSLETGIAKASAAGDLNGAVALRNEQKRFADTNVFPEQDEAADAASVKQLRTAIRAQLAKLETANAARVKAIHVKYDAVLAQAQTQLTQRQRLDDALLVKAKRDEVAAAWLAGLPAAPAPVAVAEQPKPPGPGAGPKVAANSALESAAAKTFEMRMIGSKWTFPWPGGNQTVRLEENGRLVLEWATSTPRTWKVVRDGVIEVFPYSVPTKSETIEAHASARSGTLIREGKRLNIRRLD